MISSLTEVFVIIFLHIFSMLNREYACQVKLNHFSYDLNNISETHQAQLAWNAEFHYLTDECGGEEMDAVIANNFIELLRRSPFGMAGACNEDCKIENVQVECGEKTRRKRDVADDKQTATIPLTVSFVLKVPLPSNSSQSDLNATLLQILNNIQAALNESDMTLNISGMFIETDPSKPPKLRFFRLVCDQGQVQKGTTCGKSL